MVVLETQTDSDAAHTRSSPVDSQHRGAMAHAAAELSELQNCASSVSVLVPQRRFASSSDGCCQRTSRQRGSGPPEWCNRAEQAASERAPQQRRSERAACGRPSMFRR